MVSCYLPLSHIVVLSLMLIYLQPWQNSLQIKSTNIHPTLNPPPKSILVLNTPEHLQPPFHHQTISHYKHNHNTSLSSSTSHLPWWWSVLHHCTINTISRCFSHRTNQHNCNHIRSSVSLATYFTKSSPQRLLLHTGNHRQGIFISYRHVFLCIYFISLQQQHHPCRSNTIPQPTSTLTYIHECN